MKLRYISIMSHNGGLANQQIGHLAINKQRLGVNKHSGSALVIAIFLILVISLLSSAMMVLQRDSSEMTSHEVYAARAYLSAYSASEIALVELFPLQRQGASDALSSCNNISTNPTLPNNNAGFHGCRVNVDCLSPPVSGSMATRFKVVNSARCETAQISTRRQITVEASDL